MTPSMITFCKQVKTFLIRQTFNLDISLLKLQVLVVHIQAQLFWFILCLISFGLFNICITVLVFFFSSALRDSASQKVSRKKLINK